MPPDTTRLAEADRDLLESECRKYGIEPARLDLLLRHLDGNFKATYGAKDWIIKELTDSCLRRDEELVEAQAQVRVLTASLSAPPQAHEEADGHAEAAERADETLRRFIDFADHPDEGPTKRAAFSAISTLVARASRPGCLWG